LNSSSLNDVFHSFRFFKNKLKKYLLFEMNETIEAEQIIEVSALIEKRKKELGL